MSATPNAYVRAHALWSSLADAPTWLLGQCHPTATQPPAALLPVRARGRASLVTRLFAEVLEQVTRDAPELRSSAPTFYGSRYGEIVILDALLQMAHEGDGKLSPARFQNSVHNGAAGQLSIALGNRTMSTSIAGGAHTVAATIEEALIWLAVEGGDALVLLADEVVPPRLGGGPNDYALGMALWLSTTPDTQAASPRIAVSRVQPQATPPSPTLASHVLDGNPLANGLALMHALHRLENASIAVDADAPQPRWLHLTYG